MIKIGLTGSIASGKTTASKIIASRRGPLFSADKVVKELYNRDSFKRLIAKRLNFQNNSASYFHLTSPPTIHVHCGLGCM